MQTRENGKPPTSGIRHPNAPQRITKPYPSRPKVPSRSEYSKCIPFHYKISKKHAAGTQQSRNYNRCASRPNLTSNSIQCSRSETGRSESTKGKQGRRETSDIRHPTSKSTTKNHQNPTRAVQSIFQKPIFKMYPLSPQD